MKITKKSIIIGMAMICFFMIVSMASGYVNHIQSRGLNITDPEALTAVSENVEALDIVRYSLGELEEDIIDGHGCRKEGTTSSYCPVCYGPFITHTAINLYSSLQIVDRGYVLKDGDTFCKGDELNTFADTKSGEWFSKGGPEDTPPIQWLSCPELESMLTDLIEWHKVNSYPNNYRPTMSDTLPDTYVVDNDAVNREDIVVYRTPVDSNYGVWSAYLSLLCCQDEMTPLDESESEDESVYQVDTNPICMMYFDSLSSTNWGDKFAVPSIAYNYLPTFKPLIYGNEENNPRIGFSGTGGNHFSDMNWIDEYFEMSMFGASHSMTLTEVDPALGERGPDIEIKRSYYQPTLYEGAPLYLRMVVKNTGDMLAHIDTVSLNAPEYEILYAPQSLFGGETSEIIIETTATDMSELKVQVDYFADEVGCLPTKDFTESFSFGNIDAIPLPPCKSNADCDVLSIDNAVCCLGLCYDLSRGTCDDFDGDGYFEWSYY